MNKQEYKITCEKKAIEQIKKLIDKRTEPTFGIRLGLHAGGCSGYEIIFEFINTKNDKDYIFDFDNIKIVIDPKSIIYLNGTEIEYKSGLMENGFKFNIPKKISNCSCGISLTF